MKLSPWHKLQVQVLLGNVNMVVRSSIERTVHSWEITEVTDTQNSSLEADTFQT